MKKGLVTAFAIILSLFVSASAQKAEKAEKAKNEAALRKIMAALEARDLATVESFMAENVVLVQPVTFSGSIENSAMKRYEGKKAVSGFVQGLFAGFKELKFSDVSMFSTGSGKTVFVEMKSNFITAEGGASYKNIYVVKYDFEKGKVTGITEYFNPVPIAELFRVKLGKQ